MVAAQIQIHLPRKQTEMQGKKQEVGSCSERVRSWILSVFGDLVSSGMHLRGCCWISGCR